MRRLLTRLLTPLLAVSLPLSATAQSEDTLRVMLQGESAESLAALVIRSGGEVTHHLPIVNAVGALLTREQLDAALASPLIHRHIDDLSVTENPEDDALNSTGRCAGRGALDLQRSDNTATWRLYNKREAPLPLLGLNLQWPAALGQASLAAIDGQTITRDYVVADKPGRLEIVFPPAKAPPVGQPSALTLRFADSSDRPTVSSIKQREFSFTAEFNADCSDQLIPGYDDNFSDSYYTGVTDAEELHTHGVTGRGVTVAVLDSGLWEHDTLARNTRGENRIVARYDAIAGKEGATVFDESGHGTHLTSALASSDPIVRDGLPSGAYKGIAPDANLVAIKAFDQKGRGDFLDIIRGIQWLIDNRQAYNIKVLNLSFAAPPRWPYWLDPINQALMRAWASGITVVAAAGNEGPAPMTVGSPGNLPYIITVGAVTDSWTPGSRDDDYVPDFSSRGPTPSAHIKPDVVAPGGHIIGITRPGSGLTLEHPEYLLTDQHLVMTGTSQASAIVSGVIALLLQLQPDLTPDDVKCTLITSAELAINEDGLLAYTPFQQGNGYVSAKRAVTLGQRGCGNTDLNIEQDISGAQHFEGPAIVESDGTVSLPGLNRMVSPEPSAKGYSESRRWGAKAHIERKATQTRHNVGDNTIFRWEERYLEERALIERLANPSPE